MLSSKGFARQHYGHGKQKCFVHLTLVEESNLILNLYHNLKTMQSSPIYY